VLEISILKQILKAQIVGKS